MWQHRGDGGGFWMGLVEGSGDSELIEEGEFTSLVGRLLVAMPGMVDPNFARTVVLMIEHTPEGAVGLVLNRPSEAGLLDHLPGWWTAAADPRVVFVGGPVGEGGGLGLARGEGSAPLEGWPEVVGVRVVDLETEPGVDSVLEARVFAGYSGWGPGQLESELAARGWFVVDGEPEDVFTAKPEGLWEEVLKRAGGKYAFFATYPENPRLN